jgi:23S rRNA pseudouridine2605 synthase
MGNRRPPRRGNDGQHHGHGQSHGTRPRPGGPARRNRPPAPAPAMRSARKALPSLEPPPQGGDPERLQKVLAHAGIGSRRACEELILQGRVTVDGQVVRALGTRVDPTRQKVAVDGQRIHEERLVYYAVSKPKGYVSTNFDPAGKPRVVDILPEIPQRVYSVGRLDEQSTGLMILTNDGELANRLAHPRFGVEKIYRVVVAGTPDREVLNKLTDGVWLAEGKVRAKRVRVAGTRGEATILEMTLAEGKNREVRRMMASFGHKVMTLTRVAVGPVTLKGLKPGEYRPLSATEVGLLRKVAAGIPIGPSRSHDRSPRPPKRGGARVQGSTAPPRATSGPPPRPARPAQNQSYPTAQAQGPRGPRRGPFRPHSSGPRLGPAPGNGHGVSGRPPRPAGPPPSRRRPASLPPSTETDLPRRRIIGLDSGSEAGPPPRPRPSARRPVPKRRPHPRTSLGPRRPSPTNDQGE